MRRSPVISVITVFLGAMVSIAGTNLNSSKSNLYRLTYPTDLVS